MALHLQRDWSPVIGEFIQLRLNNKTIRDGVVDAVTADDTILWMAADAFNPRELFSRDDEIQVWIEYKWETPAA